MKGRGVWTECEIEKGACVLQYKGEVVTEQEAVERERFTDENQNYIFFFKHGLVVHLEKAHLVIILLHV